jgi:hypothetical protein
VFVLFCGLSLGDFTSAMHKFEGLYLFVLFHNAILCVSLSLLVHCYPFRFTSCAKFGTCIAVSVNGTLLKLKCAHSPLNLHILSSTSVPFTLGVQVPNLAQVETRRITAWVLKKMDIWVRLYLHQAD